MEARKINGGKQTKLKTIPKKFARRWVEKTESGWNCANWTGSRQGNSIYKNRNTKLAMKNRQGESTYQFGRGSSAWPLRFLCQNPNPRLNPNLGLLSLVIILAEELASTEEDRRREGRRIKWRDREDGDRKVKYAQVLFITAEISSVLTAAIDGIHPDRSILAVASRSPMRGQCRGAKCLLDTQWMGEKVNFFEVTCLFFFNMKGNMFVRWRSITWCNFWLDSLDYGSIHQQDCRLVS